MQEYNEIHTVENSTDMNNKLSLCERQENVCDLEPM